MEERTKKDAEGGAGRAEARVVERWTAGWKVGAFVRAEMMVLYLLTRHTQREAGASASVSRSADVVMARRCSRALGEERRSPS